MRTSFRQFLFEAGFNTTGFGADTRHGFWGLPSLNYGAMTAQRTPPGGYQNFGQMTQHYQNLSRFQDADYIEQQTLEKLSLLAENAAVGINNIKMGQKDPTGHYEYADIQGRMITGLKEQDIISGLYPRLRHEEMRRGEQLGILIHDTNTGLYNLNVDSLRDRLVEMRNKLSQKEFRYQQGQHVTGQIDKAFDAMTGPGRLQLSKSANPFQ